jgi:hypothetical protein
VSHLEIPPFPRIWAGDLARGLIPWTAALLRGEFARRSFVDTAGVCTAGPDPQGEAHETCDGRHQAIQARPDRERQDFVLDPQSAEHIRAGETGAAAI